MLIYYYYTYHIILFHATIKNTPAISILRSWLHTTRNLYNVAQTIITCLSCKYEEAFAQLLVRGYSIVHVTLCLVLEWTRVDPLQEKGPKTGISGLFPQPGVR